jgi:hypothetical protein
VKKKTSPHAVSVDRRGFVYDLSQGFKSDARGKGRPGVTNKTQASGITFDDWRAAMKEAEDTPIVRDPGVKTMREFADMWGIADSTARNKIRILLEAGLVERLDIFTRRVNGARFRTLGYRLVKK